MKISDQEVSTKSLKDDSSGYSIIELVVVLAGLSVLASISLMGLDGQGGILGSIKMAKIDEVKALLNRAAADCLQKARTGGSDKDLINDEVISDKRINQIGFKINRADKADKCSYFQLIPTNNSDEIQYPIGFSVIDGSLSKFATPTSTNAKSISSCESWAGVNCKQDNSIKELVDWKKGIQEAKNECQIKFEKWVSGGTTPYFLEKAGWVSTADSGCPTRPSKQDPSGYKNDPTCTPNGCLRTVYGLDGEFVGYEKEDYDRALLAQYGADCAVWKGDKEKAAYTNDLQRLAPVTKSPECGSQEFWFFKGVDQSTKTKFLETACNAWVAEKSKSGYSNSPLNEPQSTPECENQKFWFLDGVDYKTQAAMNAKLLDSASGKCEIDREKDRAAGFTGKWGPREGPGVCAEESYICNKKIVSEYDFYRDCSQEIAPEKCKGYLSKEDQDCTDYELSDYWYKKCGPRPFRCSVVGMGKPGNVSGWDVYPNCSAWAKCIKLY